MIEIMSYLKELSSECDYIIEKIDYTGRCVVKHPMFSGSINISVIKENDSLYSFELIREEDMKILRYESVLQAVMDGWRELKEEIDD